MKVISLLSQPICLSPCPRFCGVEEVKNVNCLSMMRSRDFARDYGILIEDGPLAGITARAVIVLDDSNKVVYSQLVAEIADEPDYAAAGAANAKTTVGYYLNTNPVPGA